MVNKGVAQSEVGSMQPVHHLVDTSTPCPRITRRLCYANLHNVGFTTFGRYRAIRIAL